jgi:hypothetical protein
MSSSRHGRDLSNRLSAASTRGPLMTTRTTSQSVHGWSLRVRFSRKQCVGDWMMSWDRSTSASGGPPSSLRATLQAAPMNGGVAYLLPSAASSLRTSSVWTCDRRRSHSSANAHAQRQERMVLPPAEAAAGSTPSVQGRTLPREGVVGQPLPFLAPIALVRAPWLLSLLLVLVAARPDRAGHAVPSRPRVGRAGAPQPRVCRWPAVRPRPHGQGPNAPRDRGGLPPHQQWTTSKTQCALTRQERATSGMFACRVRSEIRVQSAPWLAHLHRAKHVAAGTATEWSTLPRLRRCGDRHGGAAHRGDRMDYQPRRAQAM